MVVFIGGKAPVAISHVVTPAASGSGLTTYTFASVDISGADAAAQILVIARGNSGADSRSVSSITVGGNATTLDATAATGGSPDNASAMAIARGVNPGGTVSIVVTFSGSMNAANIDVFAVLNAASVTDTISITAGSLTVSDTMDVAVGGSVLAGVCHNGTNCGTGTIAWTGANEQTDAQVVNANNRFGSAFEDISAGASGRTIQAVDSAGTSPNSTLVAVSYAP